jgi:hypothetical protein
MRPTRTALALLVLITLVIGAPALTHAQTHVAGPTSAMVFDDDPTDGVSAAVVTSFELPAPYERVIVLDCTRPLVTAVTRLAILSTAPKTSPTASRS